MPSAEEDPQAGEEEEDEEDNEDDAFLEKVNWSQIQIINYYNSSRKHLHLEGYSITLKSPLLYSFIMA